MTPLPPSEHALPPGAGDPLRTFGGMFRDAALETAFEQDRAPESVRHARGLLGAAVLINLLFLISDWRFHGTPHFWLALSARLVVVAWAATALLLVTRLRSAAVLHRVLVAWMIGNALPVGLLVTSGSEIALVIAFLLPAIYYLCVPVRFGWTLGCGVFASAAMLAGLASSDLPRGNGIGILLAMMMANVALALTVTRANRMSRTAWLAARTESGLRAALDRSRAQLQRLFDACPVPLILTDRASGSLIRMSDSCAALIGSAPSSALAGPGPADPAAERLARTLGADAGATDYEVQLATADRGDRTLLVHAAALEVDGRDVVLAGLVDITRRKAEQTSLERLASTDALTGLRNRLSFFAAARAEMLRATRTRQPLALLMVDLDHFKAINDSRGHSAGDAALRAFGALCTRTLDPGAVIGRLGGEEFGVLLRSESSDAAAGAESLRAATAALRIGLAQGPPLALTVSIGIAAVSPNDRDIDAALARADLALYAAKHGGRNRVVAEQADAARMARTG
ncbi:GGDEF domain-containing protein [Sphingomonas jatrophae]|uniref:diguanylate cyclase n=1 Tax=Sphingomonas jatrophae TaxID=1166337 RepID=A0A1I6LDY8_9SPHN|nr:GGDEF domain-containing protein [Sphingomonas jatrophae]SFS01480.1 diguanylate cyclase (GGDEF) domain-containing protein [Sphingomonas jatrophae]